jgi:NADH dehydrogenase
MIQWAWNYFTRGRGARLITGEGTLVREEGIKINNERIAARQENLVAK